MVSENTVSSLFSSVLLIVFEKEEHSACFPDQFVLCLEGASGQEQHVSIDRQELLLAANPQMQAVGGEERGTIKSPVGSRNGGLFMTQNGPQYVADSQDGMARGWQCPSANSPICQNQVCHELELQKMRLQQREEACRRREEEVRQREDEAKRQKMTIAALEGEVQKVTEEMQEILLQKEEGRLIVQRELIGKLDCSGKNVKGYECSRLLTFFLN